MTKEQATKASLDLDLRAQSEEFKLEVARFESKWYKNLRKKSIEAESDDPSRPHNPPRDSTADTYVPLPLPIPAKESRTPRSKMVKIFTL